jgi:tetrahydromethanopterin S-methyltransferase subunit H
MTRETASIVVGGHTFGGPLGANSTAIFGTIFFASQQLMKDPEQGLFDEAKAHAQVMTASRSCQEAGAALFLDVVAETARAMERELEFIIGRTILPCLIDASDEETKLAGLDLASARGALDRCVYNSISVDSSKHELASLAAKPPAAIIVSAMDPMDYGAHSAMRVLSEVKDRLPASLHGRLLLDVGFLDEASVAMSCQVARELRLSAELPVGGAPCNGLHMWQSLITRGDAAFRAALCATLGFCGGCGLDFVFAGPLRYAAASSVALGVSDVYNRYQLMREKGRAGWTEGHPITALFR